MLDDFLIVSPRKTADTDDVTLERGRSEGALFDSLLMKLHFFPKTAQKLVFLRKKEMKLFYEIMVNREKIMKPLEVSPSEVSPKIVNFQK